MNPFAALVKRATRELPKPGAALDAFPDVATRLLTDFEYGLTQDQLDEGLARWFLKTAELPEQVSLHNTFGQPPITLFNNGTFVVDLYLWLTCDTSIHSHGFRGAFRVLHGKSLHETFDVKVSRRVAPGVMQCEPGIPVMALLEPGDVRTILLGEKLTHRVIHLESPTVTLCVKTINEPGIYQWEYHPDGLAIQRRHLKPGLVKEIYFFQYLLGENPGRALPYLEKLIGALSVVGRMNLYEEVCGGGLDLSDEALEHVLAQIRERHGREDWFRRYETPVPLHLKELNFAGCDSSLDRLVAHFINGGHDFRTVSPHLSHLAGRELSKIDVHRVISSLMDFEPIFGCELAIEDRAAIKDLVAHPHRKIPRHLQPFGQIRRMRDFIGMFGG
jgi:hypothetical protein